MNHPAYHRAPPIEHTGTQQAVCPHCGYVDPSSWELRDDEDVTRCQNCGKPFRWSREIEVTYTTEAMEGE